MWENPMDGVNVVRRSLLLRLSEGEHVGQLLKANKGSYCKELEGWLLDYRSLLFSHFDTSGKWVKVEGDFAVFKPRRGLQLSTTFLELSDGQALCRVEVVKTDTLITAIFYLDNFTGWRLWVFGARGRGWDD